MRDFLAQLPQTRKGRRLVALHQPTRTGDIGHHDCRQPALGRRRRHDGLSLHDPESYPIAFTIDAIAILEAHARPPCNASLMRA
jgi:hypothetical protein